MTFIGRSVHRLCIGIYDPQSFFKYPFRPENEFWAQFQPKSLFTREYDDKFSSHIMIFFPSTMSFSWNKLAIRKIQVSRVYFKILNVLLCNHQSLLTKSNNIWVISDFVIKHFVYEFLACVDSTGKAYTWREGLWLQ